MGRILGLLIFALTIISIVLFASGHWPPPMSADGHAMPAISEMGRAIDAQFGRIMVVVAVAFILAQVALGYILFRYGSTGNKSERALYSHGNNKLEVTWTIITAVVFVTLGIMAQKVWAELHLTAPPADSIEYEVTAQQFVWKFHHPGPDGKLGRLNMDLWKDPDSFGVDETDTHNQRTTLSARPWLCRSIIRSRSLCDQRM